MAYAVNSNCTHKGVTFCFRVGKCRVFAGSKVQAMLSLEWDLMVSCLGNQAVDRPDNPISGNAGAKELLGEDLMVVQPPPWFGIDWPDRSAPTLARSWWIKFTEALENIDGDVVFFCVGGHGRTGTALSCIVGLSEYVRPAKKTKNGKSPAPIKKSTDFDPVLFVRSQYCDEAVESGSQMDYIENVTGWRVDAPIPTKTTYPAYGGGYAGTGGGYGGTGKANGGTGVTHSSPPPATGKVTTMGPNGQTGGSKVPAAGGGKSDYQQEFDYNKPYPNSTWSPWDLEVRKEIDGTGNADWYITLGSTEVNAADIDPEILDWFELEWAWEPSEGVYNLVDKYSGAPAECETVGEDESESSYDVIDPYSSSG